MDVTAQITGIARMLEASSLGSFVRMVPHPYPILESLHIIGIALLVGSAVAFDLRLLGVGRHAVSMTVVAKHLLPIAHIGFVIVALTGAAMFCGIAVSVVNSSAAIWKFGLIGVAGLNILIFHSGIYRSVAKWEATMPPFPARLAALTSVSTWTGVVFAGRFLAY